MTDSPYLTPAQVRARISRGGPALSSTEFDDTWVAGVVTEWEQKLEDQLGCAQIPRTKVETVRVPGYTDRLFLRATKVRAITSLVIGGVTAAASSYYLVGSTLRYYGTFAPGVSVVVTYTHGLDAPPEGILRATAMYVERVASQDRSGSTTSVRANVFEGGGVQVLTRPDPDGGKLTGWDEIDSIVNSQPDYRPKVGG